MEFHYNNIYIFYMENWQSDCIRQNMLWTTKSYNKLNKFKNDCLCEIIIIVHLYEWIYPLAWATFWLRGERNIDKIGIVNQQSLTKWY